MPFTKLLVYISIILICNFTLSCKQKAAPSATTTEFVPTIIPINISYSTIPNTVATNWSSLIDDYYKNILSKNLNGQFLIAKNGVILYESYNGTERLNATTTQPMNEHSALHLASVSKTFTAAAILLLQQQGKLSINDYVVKYLPTFPYPTITIKMLLSHRAGLANYVHNLVNWGWHSTALATNADVLDQLATIKPPLNFVPDTKFNYCNTNYAMLALVIEKASGLPYPKFMYQQIFAPLQMNDTYVFTLKDTATAIPSYDWRGNKIKWENLDGVYGDKNIYSTVKDLYKWDQAWYSNALLTDATKALAFIPYSNEKPGIKNYGLGWRMLNFVNGKKIIFHNGWWHGNNNAFIRLLQDSATIICLGNKYNKANYGTMQMAYLFGDYPFEYEAEEGKDTAKNAEINSMLLLKLRADSMKLVKYNLYKKDSLQLIKDSLKMLKPKRLKIENDTDITAPY